jgi:hypothetical protein
MKLIFKIWPIQGNMRTSCANIPMIDKKSGYLWFLWHEENLIYWLSEGNFKYKPKRLA